MSICNGRSIGQKRCIVKRGKISYTAEVIEFTDMVFACAEAISTPTMSESLYPIKLYLKYLPNAVMISVSLVMNIAMWGWLLLSIHPQTEQLFLHYTILFGVDLIGPWNKIFFLPMSGLLIICVNALVGWIMFKSDKFFGQILNAISVFCQIMFLIGSWLIVYLNV